MKKTLSLLLISLLFLGPLLNFAFAQSVPTEIPLIGRCLVLGDTVPRLVCVAEKIAILLALVAFVYSVIQFFAAGWIFLSGGEKEENVKTAKSKLLYAAVGLVVAILAYALSLAIAKLFGLVIQ